MIPARQVELGARSYPVHFRLQAEDQLIEALHRACTTGHALMITDDVVRTLHADRIAEALRERGVVVTLLSFPPGEHSKTRETVHRLQDEALDAGVDRRTPVIAVGGGIPGDVAGYVAASVLRGLPFIQVPTTLLAMVDSSVGGKTGVNHPRGKNLVGAFHQPTAVHIDTAYLQTLPAREIRAGLAEAIKHAALARPDRLEAWADLGQAPTPAELLAVVADAVAIKADVVEADEREAGLRQVLNFGHTLGHAIEAAAPGRWRHGEAVAIGMSFATALSVKVAGLPAAEAARIDHALSQVGLPTDWKPWIRGDVLDRLASDKKIRGKYVNVVVLEALGRPRVHPMTLATLRTQARVMAGRGEDR
jgi:3-dehydroquinate synthase